MKNKILIGLVVILCIETLWLAVVNRNLRAKWSKETLVAACLMLPPVVSAA